MSKLPTAHEVYEKIVRIAKRQAATTAEGQAILAAGLEKQLHDLIVAIAGNASMPIAADYEDAINGGEDMA